MCLTNNTHTELSLLSTDSLPIIFTKEKVEEFLLLLQYLLRLFKKIRCSLRRKKREPDES